MEVSSSDFEYIADVVRKDSAIVLDESKSYLIRTRLGRLLDQEGLSDLEMLVLKLRQVGNSVLRVKVVEALTTNETLFFRDFQLFEGLRNQIIPEIIEKNKESKRLSIWSAACSTGQEPYSIAMLLEEHFPQIKDWFVTIHATDISTEVLEKAQSGCYSQAEVNRGLPASYLVKYFSRQSDQWVLRPSLVSKIKFSQYNLADGITLPLSYDLIFIRNVLIYFDIATKQQILGRIKKNLNRNGYLFLGTAETTLNLDAEFNRRSLGKCSCYSLSNESVAK